VCVALLLPTLRDVYAEVGVALDAHLWWVLLAAACETLGFVSTWRLQQLTLRADTLTEVAVPQLTGNAVSNVLPMGSAAGSVVQLRLLCRAGFGVTRAASSLAVAGLLSSLAALLVFPLVLALPIGSAPAGTDTTAELGLVALATLIAVSVLALRTRRPLLAVGRFVSAIGSHLPRCRPPVDLPEQLLRQRDEIRDVIARNRWTVALTSVGRAVGDFLALYVSVLAVGARPNPAVVLLAFAATNAAGMIPLTPGGLGFVEAGLAGILAFAGLGHEQALVSVAIYRLASCWLPVVAGAIAYAASAARTAASDEAAPIVVPCTAALTGPS